MSSRTIDVSEAALLAWCRARGIEIVVMDIAGSRWGWYSLRDGVIAIQEGLSQTQRVATLLHEIEHVRRHDDGPQPQYVEDAIDEKVARTLIEPDDYRRAVDDEDFHGNLFALARRLGTCGWVVQAFQRTHQLEVMPVPS
ncbi:MAG: hypothetical protein LKI58_10210 [Actinomyces sp.]|nr:ImmA/IrrE family metallo-endopeptidase [Actinomyces sp.]MCI1788416.1 hypothetical protein [Actinomyces sp.]